MPSAYGTEGLGLQALGIYEIKDGRLKIRLARVLPALNFDQRPSSFAVTPDSGDILFTLKHFDLPRTSRHWSAAGPLGCNLAE